MTTDHAGSMPVRSVSRRWTGAVVLLAAIAGCALTGRLGLWQLDRAATKIALQQAIDDRSTMPPLAVADLAREPGTAAQQHHRTIRLRGRWLADATVWLDNRQMDGRPGFYVVTPLLLAPGDAVLVQRGWVPRNLLDRTARPPLDTPSREVEIEGRIAPPPARLFEFSDEASGPIRQNLDLDRHARELGIGLRPLSLLQIESPEAAPDGLQRRWSRPAVDVSKHHGYAFQWFALCALIAGLYVWFQLVRPRLGRATR